MQKWGEQRIGNKDIRGCIGCRKCKQTGKSVFSDIVNETAPEFAECDSIKGYIANS